MPAIEMVMVGHGGARLRLNVWCVLFLVIGWTGLACAVEKRTAARPTLPGEIASSHFLVTVNGRRVAVGHAAANYFFANFDAAGPVTVRVAAATDGYWSRGVEEQP